MKGYSPKLPLTLDPNDGYLLTHNLKEVVAQNLKMLILTSPGERIMEPLFGVGVYNYLFELNTIHTQIAIKERILQQTKKYMPFVQILQIEFMDPEQGGDFEALGISIRYSIPSINSTDILRINLE